VPDDRGLLRRVVPNATVFHERDFARSPPSRSHCSSVMVSSFGIPYARRGSPVEGITQHLWQLNSAEAVIDEEVRQPGGMRHGVRPSISGAGTFMGREVRVARWGPHLLVDHRAVLAARECGDADVGRTHRLRSRDVGRGCVVSTIAVVLQGVAEILGR